MIDNEKTEELLNDQKVKKRIKPKYLIIIGGLIVLIMALIGFYFYYQSYQYDQNLNLGKKYFEEGDYDQAILAFNEAINIDDRKVEPYDFLIEIYITIGDFGSAEEVAQNRPQPGGPDVEPGTNLDQILFGNSNGNIHNTGLVIQKDLEDFLVLGEGNESILYSLKGDNKKEISKSKMNFYDESFKYLNLFGIKLYYYDDNKIKVYNTLSNEINDLNIPGIDTSSVYIENMIIYKGDLYFILHQGDWESDVTVEKVNLSNLTRTTIIPHGDTSQFVLSFVISNNQIYYRYADGLNMDLKVADLNGEGQTTLFTEEISSYASNFSFSGNDDDVFIVSDSNLGYRNCIKKINTKNHNTNTIITENEEATINTINNDNKNIYYLVDGTLFQCDFNGDNIKEIFSLTKEKQEIYIAYFQDGKYINLTEKYIYLEYLTFNLQEEMTEDGFIIEKMDDNVNRLVVRINKENFSDIEIINS